MEDAGSPPKGVSASSLVKEKAGPELYKVSPSYVEMWRETEKRFDNRIMPVYGPNRSLVPYNLFPKFLKAGTTVIVSFNLVHYAFKDDNRPGAFLYDGYTANVTEVIILDLHDEAPSRPLSTPKRKGKFISQSPLSHATLKFAADTFLPVPSEASPSATDKNKADKGKQAEVQGDIAPSAGTSEPVLDTVRRDGSSRTGMGTSFLDIVALANAAASRAEESGSPVDEALMRRLLPVIAEYFQASLSSDVGVAAPPGTNVSVERAVTPAATITSSTDAGVTMTSTAHILPTSPSDNPQISTDPRLPIADQREDTRPYPSARQSSSVDRDIGNANDLPPALSLPDVDRSPVAGGQENVTVAKDSSNSGSEYRKPSSGNRRSVGIYILMLCRYTGSNEIQPPRGNQDKRESRRRK